MIPILKTADGPAALYADFLAELRLRGFEGEITHAHADRTVFATDNSIYQVPPQAVVFPRHELDVVRLAKLSSEPRFSGISVRAARRWHGHQWSVADRAASSVDLSRHMNAILEINAEEGWARVQAGVVKDQLNEAVRPPRPVLCARAVAVQPRHHRRHDCHRCQRTGVGALRQDARSCARAAGRPAGRHARGIRARWRRPSSTRSRAAATASARSIACSTGSASMTRH